MATDLERLTASFDADITRWEKKMDQLGVSFDRQAKLIDKKGETLQQSLDKKLGAIGGAADSSGKLGKLGEALGSVATKGALIAGVATAAGIGLTDLVKTTLEAAASIGDVAQQAGVSTDFLQKLRFAGSQTGATFADVDTGLTKLNENFGELINTGGGKAAAAFKELGIDKLFNAGQVQNTEQAFNAVLARLNSVGTEAQKASIAAKIFGQEAGPHLVQLLESGTTAVSDLEAKAASLGIVLSSKVIDGAKDANDKLTALFDVMKAEGVNAIAQLAPKIAEIAGEITAALPDIVAYAESWAKFFGLLHDSPLDELNSQIADLQQKLKSGPSFWDTLFVDKGNVIAEWKAQLAAVTRQRDALLPKTGEETVTVTALRPKQGKIPLTPEELAAQNRQAEALARTVLDAKTANAALSAAQNETNVTLLKGSADYYAAVQKQIYDAYQAKVTVAEADAGKQAEDVQKNITNEKARAQALINIADALNAKILAAAQERQKASFEAGPSSLVQAALIQGDAQIKQLQDETAALGLSAGAAAKFAYEQGLINAAKEKGIILTQQQIEADPDLKKKADEIAAQAAAQDKANRAMQDSIQFADSLRTGLEDIGSAGLQGFKSMKEAAASFLEQIAELIVKLYVMKPLVESVLGPSGTPAAGGGLIAGIGSLLGFASGGRPPVGVASVVGEHGPELFVPDQPGTVVPNNMITSMPQAAARGGGSSVLNFSIDARGAQMGVADQITAQLQAVVPKILQAADKRNAAAFTGRLRVAQRDAF